MVISKSLQSCIALINRKLQQRMKSFMNCSMMMCSVSDEPVEETLQEKISLAHISSAKEHSITCTNTQTGKARSKEIFSFRLNCFRDYHESDKIRYGRGDRSEGIGRDMVCWHKCRSSERMPRMSTQLLPVRQENQRQHCPRPHLQNQTNILNRHEGVNKNSSVVNSTIANHFNEPRATFKTTSKVFFSQAIDLARKRSNETSHSSKNCSANPGQDQVTPPQPSLSFHPPKESAPTQRKQQMKCESSFSLPAFISNNSIPTQKLNDKYPTFQHLDITEQRKFFQNVKTIKTIFTSTELREQSGFTSFRDSATQNSQDNDLNCEESAIKTEKNCQRKDKKKTAYFGFGEEHKTQRTLIGRLNEDPIRERSIENDFNMPNESFQRPKKVHFMFQSKFKNSKIEQIKHLNFKKENRPILKYNSHANFAPSLNCIGQSAAISSKEMKQNPTSIDNSSKELTQMGAQQQALRFKNINTIKSIGGQSIFSQNSYIDIKFMQSIKSRRALVKLV